MLIGQEQWAEWKLSWGRRPGQSFRMSKPGISPPAQVLLVDTADPGPRSKMKTMPEHLFPATVAATGGLHSVMLDHVPRWAPAQRQALLDWIRCGGQLHLVQGDNGQRPRFAGALSPLNSLLTVHPIGAGIVVQHDVRRDEITAKYLQEQGYGPPAISEEYQHGYYFNLNQQLTTKLMRISRPDHNWPLIYIVAVVYVMLVGPLHFLLSRRKLEYRLSIGVALLAVLVFGSMFFLIGRRGFGEASTVHSLAYARAIEPGQYDVAQWANVFVVRGADYLIKHDSPHNLYATPTQQEAVNAVMYNGADGFLSADIPLYSSRPFVHRGRMSGPTISAQVTWWPGPEDQRRLEITMAGTELAGVTQGWAVVGDRVYVLHATERSLTAASTGGKDIAEYLSLRNLADDPYAYMGRFGSGYDDEEQEIAIEQRLRQMAPMLIARALHVTDGVAIEDIVRHDRVELFILADTTDQFQEKPSGLGRHQGAVLYHLTILESSEGGSGDE